MKLSLSEKGISFVKDIKNSLRAKKDKERLEKLKEMRNEKNKNMLLNSLGSFYNRSSLIKRFSSDKIEKKTSYQLYRENKKSLLLQTKKYSDSLDTIFFNKKMEKISSQAKQKSRLKRLKERIGSIIERPKSVVKTTKISSQRILKYKNITKEIEKAQKKDNKSNNNSLDDFENEIREMSKLNRLIGKYNIHSKLYKAKKKKLRDRIDLEPSDHIEETKRLHNSVNEVQNEFNQICIRMPIYTKIQERNSKKNKKNSGAFYFRDDSNLNMKRYEENIQQVRKRRKKKPRMVFNFSKF